MEGIFDGGARDGCFLCELLFPDRHAEDCPRCGKRMRYHSAEMADAVFIAARVEELCDAYQKSSTQHNLEALCALVHRFWPSSEEPLLRQGHTLPVLRARWNELQVAE